MVCRQVLVKVRNGSSKFIEKFKTCILCSIISFPDKLIIYEIMWKDIVEPDGPQMAYGSCAFHAGYIYVYIYKPVSERSFTFSDA
jgi:hypothetical protein